MIMNIRYQSPVCSTCASRSPDVRVQMCESQIDPETKKPDKDTELEMRCAEEEAGGQLSVNIVSGVGVE